VRRSNERVTAQVAGSQLTQWLHDEASGVKFRNKMVPAKTVLFASAIGSV